MNPARAPKSKDALAAQAIRRTCEEGAAVWAKLRDGGPDALSAFIDAYQCQTHARDPGCSLAACVSEIGRQDPAIGAAYAEGLRRMSDLVRQALPAGTPPGDAQSRAIALLSGMVGALAIARALEKADPELSRDLRGRSGRVEAPRLHVEERAGCWLTGTAASPLAGDLCLWPDCSLRGGEPHG
jgi:AcrR family transcriptional regulator